MFGKARRRKMRTKEKKDCYIMKETDNNPGAEVSVDQIQSDKPVLVPEFSGKLTSVLI